MSTDIQQLLGGNAVSGVLDERGSASGMFGNPGLILPFDSSVVVFEPLSLSAPPAG